MPRYRKHWRQSENSLFSVITVSYFSVLCIIIVHVKQCQTSKEIFHGPASRIEKIIQIEKRIESALQDYVRNLERRLLIAKRYLKDYEETSNHGEHFIANDDGTNPIKENQISIEESIVFNPLKLFRLIRRFTQTLPSLEKELHQDHERSFQKTLENFRKGVSLPQQLDLDSAIEGLIRVQDAYEFNVLSFTRGDFNGLFTNTSLNAADCYLIGTYSLNANIYTRAIEWLHTAYYLVQEHFDNSISIQIVQNRLQEAIFRHNSAFQSSGPKPPYLFRDQLDIESLSNMVDNERRSKIFDKPTPQLYLTQSSFMDLTNFAALCRGEQLQPPVANKALTCWLDRSSPLTIYSPLRVELLHNEPRVLQIYDVISSNLSEEIIAAAEKTSIGRSKVHGKGSDTHGAVSASRTSASTWIQNDKVLKRVEKIYPRLQNVLGLNLLSPGALEEFQVSSYKTTGHYNPHLDNILTPDIKSRMNKEEVAKGDRMGTLMFYLSDVQRGGKTAFPRLGITASPVKGSALFWFNCKRNGEAEPLSLHGSCPIIYGIKQIATAWIRSNSQMFTRKCLL